MLSTTTSTRNHPPSTIALARRGSRRPSSLVGAGPVSGSGVTFASPCAPSLALVRRRSTQASSATASSPNSANGSIQAAWSPSPVPNSRSGPGGPPNGIGYLARREVELDCDDAGLGAGGLAAGGLGLAVLEWWGRGTRAPGFTTTELGPPACPSTRPKPLYSNVRPSSELLVELPT